MRYITPFILIIIIIGCTNNSTSGLSSDSTTQSANMESLKTTAGLDDTIITPGEFAELSEKLKNFNLSPKELQYIQNSLKKAKRVDEIDSIAKKQFFYKLNNDSALIAAFRDTAANLKYQKTDTTIEAKINAFKAMQLSFALAHLSNFRKLGTSSQPVRNRILSKGFFSLSFSASDLAQLISVYNDNGKIDGLRIYLAKYNHLVDNTSNDNVRNDRYTLIMVGTKDGKDVFDINDANPQLTIQNYGDPCRPKCERIPGNSATRLDSLGALAGDQ